MFLLPVKLKQRLSILIESREKKNNLNDRAHEWEWGTWQMRTEEMRPLCYDRRDLKKKKKGKGLYLATYFSINFHTLCWMNIEMKNVQEWCKELHQNGKK